MTYSAGDQAGRGVVERNTWVDLVLVGGRQVHSC